MQRKMLSDITHNVRVKIYPDGYKIGLCASAPIFRESGWEIADQWETESREAGQMRDGVANLARSKRRARSAVFDLAYSNPFRFFVTLTLDQSKVDRYDIHAITQKLNRWLDNRVRRDGLAYILVPELHKDGAVHYHGFFSDAISAVDSGVLSPPDGGRPRKPRSNVQRSKMIKDGWHVVYNLPSWPFGFTTALELYGDRRSAAGYVCKYITKSAGKVGGRWYYSGGALLRPCIQFSDADFDELAASDHAGRFHVDGLAVDVIKFEVKEV